MQIAEVTPDECETLVVYNVLFGILVLVEAEKSAILSQFG